MRSVAPERPGSAASQNSWSVVNLKPIDGSLATTTDQTIQTANESSSAGIEIQQVAPRDGAPGASPRTPCPPAASPRWMRAGQRADVLGLVDLLHLGQFGQLARAPRRRRRAPCARMARCIQTSATPTTSRNSSMKQLCPHAGQVVERAERRSAARSRRARRSCRPGRRPRRRGSGSRPGCACRRPPCPGS